MQDYVMWGSFGLSIAVAVISAAFVRDKLSSDMGLPSWSFSGSWASNITVVGGLVGISVLAYIPKDAEPPILQEAQYKILFLVFLLFTALAPLVYNFSRRTKIVGGQIVATGKAFMFIAASIFTVWSSIGQLITQVLLIQELCNAKVLQPTVAGLIEVTLGLVVVGLVFYAGGTIVQTINMQNAMLSGTVEKSVSIPEEVLHQQWMLL